MYFDCKRLKHYCSTNIFTFCVFVFLPQSFFSSRQKQLQQHPVYLGWSKSDLSLLEDPSIPILMKHNKQNYEANVQYRKLSRVKCQLGEARIKFMLLSVRLFCALYTYTEHDSKLIISSHYYKYLNRKKHHALKQCLKVHYTQNLVNLGTQTLCRHSVAINRKWQHPIYDADCWHPGYATPFDLYTNKISFHTLSDSCVLCLHLESPYALSKKLLSPWA